VRKCTQPNRFSLFFLDIFSDRRHGADLVSEVDQGMVKIQSYVSSLKEEIKERAKLIELLEQGDVFYQHQRGEAKIVVTVSYFLFN
jgi:hypothetical protein